MNMPNLTVEALFGENRALGIQDQLARAEIIAALALNAVPGRSIGITDSVIAEFVRLRGDLALKYYWLDLGTVEVRYEPPAGHEEPTPAPGPGWRRVKCTCRDPKAPTACPLHSIAGGGSTLPPGVISHKQWVEARLLDLLREAHRLAEAEWGTQAAYSRVGELLREYRETAYDLEHIYARETE